MPQTNKKDHKYYNDNFESSYFDGTEMIDESLEGSYQIISEDIPSVDTDINIEDYSINKPRRITIKVKIIP